MAGENDQAIDAAQAQLVEAQKKEAAGAVEKGVSEREAKYETLGLFEHVFKAGGTVDVFQALDSTLYLKNSPAAVGYLDKGKGEIAGFLADMAARGKKLVDPETKGSDLATETSAVTTLGDRVRETMETYKAKLEPISSIITLGAESFPLVRKVWDDGRQFEEGKIPAKEFIGELDLAMFGINTGGEGVGGISGVRKLINNEPGMPQDFLDEINANFSQQTLNDFSARKTQIQQQEIISTAETAEKEKYSKFITLKKPEKTGGEWEIEWTAEGKKLTEEKQLEIIKALGVIKLKNEEQLEETTSPEIMAQFYEGKRLFEAGDLEKAKKAFEEFRDHDMKLKKFKKNPKLMENSKSYLDRTNDYLKQIEEGQKGIDKIVEANKDFFDGQKLAQAMDIYGAIKLFNKYLLEADQRWLAHPDYPDYSKEAREFLKRIALTQLEQVKEKFKVLTKPPEIVTVYSHVGTVRLGNDVPNPDYPQYLTCQKVIGEMEKGIISGKYKDFKEAYDALGAGLNLNSNFNPLGDEMRIENEGREGYLQLAIKYRKAKQFDLAGEYFSRYFGDKLKETGKTTITMEKLRAKYIVDDKFNQKIQARVSEAKEKYKTTQEGEDYEFPNGRNNDGKLYAELHPFGEKEEKEVYNKLVNAAISQIYPLEVQKEQNSRFQTDPTSIGGQYEQNAWGEFMNMQGMHGQGKWYEMFAVSDATLDGIIQQLPLQIALIAVSGGVASVAAKAVGGAFVGAFGGAEAIAGMGAYARGLTMLAGAAGAFGAETFVFTSSHALLNAAATRRFSFDTFGEFLEEWYENIKVMGVLGQAGKISEALKGATVLGEESSGLQKVASAMEKISGKITGFGLEMTALGALSGKLTPNDLAMMLGLKLSHAVVGKVSGEKAPDEQALKPYRDILRVQNPIMSDAEIAAMARQNYSATRASLLEKFKGQKSDAEIDVLAKQWVERLVKDHQANAPVEIANVAELTGLDRKDVARANAVDLALERAEAKRRAATEDNGNALKEMEARQAEAAAKVLAARANNSPTLEAEITEAKKILEEIKAQKAKEFAIVQSNADFLKAEHKAKEERERLTLMDTTTDPVKRSLQEKEARAAEEELSAVRARLLSEDASANKPAEAEARKKSAEFAKARAEVAREVVERSDVAEAKLKVMGDDVARLRATGDENDAKEADKLEKRIGLARKYELFETIKDPAEADRLLPLLEIAASRETIGKIDAAFKKAKGGVVALGDVRDQMTKFIAEEKKNAAGDPARLKQLQEAENLMYQLDPAKVGALTDTDLRAKITEVQNKLTEYGASLTDIRAAESPELLAMEARLRETHVWGVDGKPLGKEGATETPLIKPDGTIDATVQANFDAAIAKAIERIGVNVEDRLIFDSIKRQIISDLQIKVKNGSTRPEIVNNLVMEATESLLYQIKRSNQRQLGEHGARHINGDIQMTMAIYAAETFDQVETSEGMRYKIPVEGRPGEFKQGNLDEAIKALSPEARLMATLGGLYHDGGYSVVSLHEDVGVTGAHPAISRLLIEKNIALKELFGDKDSPSTEKNFNAFLEFIQSHDKFRTETDGAEMEFPGGGKVRIGLMVRALQLADNAALGGAEKLPPILRDSLIIKDVMRDTGQSIYKFIDDRKNFTDVEMAKLLTAGKADLKTLDPSKLLEAKSGLDKLTDLQRAELARTTDPAARIALIEGYTTKKPLSTEEKASLGALDKVQIAALDQTKLTFDLNTDYNSLDTSSFTPKQKEAFLRMKAVKDRWQTGLEDSRKAIDAEYHRGEINYAQKESALKAVTDVQKSFESAEAFPAKFLTAPTSMDILMMGDPRISAHGALVLDFNLRQGYQMDVILYGEKSLVAQIKKMPGDYVEGKINAKLNETVPAGKTYKDLSPTEKADFLKSMGLLTPADQAAAETAIDKFISEKNRGRPISNKDAADVLKGIYMDKQGVDSWLKNPDKPLKIKLDPFDPAGMLIMQIDGPAKPKLDSAEYKSAGFTETGGTPGNLYEGRMPSTAEGYKSLYTNLQQELTRTMELERKSNMSLTESREYMRRVAAIEATMANVEASYATYEAGRKYAGGKEVPKLAEGLGDTTKFGRSKQQLLEFSKQLSLEGGTDEIKAKANEVKTLLESISSETDAKIGLLQDAIKALWSMQLGVSQIQARERLRTLPAAA